MGADTRTGNNRKDTTTTTTTTTTTIIFNLIIIREEGNFIPLLVQTPGGGCGRCESARLEDEAAGRFENKNKEAERPRARTRLEKFQVEQVQQSGPTFGPLLASLNDSSAPPNAESESGAPGRPSRSHEWNWSCEMRISASDVHFTQVGRFCVQVSVQVWVFGSTWPASVVCSSFCEFSGACLAGLTGNFLACSATRN
jgi:hypothetical protein